MDSSEEPLDFIKSLLPSLTDKVKVSLPTDGQLKKYFASVNLESDTTKTNQAAYVTIWIEICSMFY